MTTHSPTAVYFDAVHRAERVLELLKSAVIYTNDGIMDALPPTAVRTVEDVLRVVHTKALQAHRQWNQNGNTAFLTSSVKTAWDGQRAGRTPLTVHIPAISGVQREDVVTLLCSFSGFRSFNMHGLATNTAMAQLLLWLMTQDELYPVMQTMIEEIECRAEYVMEIHDIRGLLILHMGLSMEYVADRMTIHENVPWEWQEPQLLQSYVELLQDTEHFHWCWSTMEIRHDM